MDRANIGMFFVLGFFGGANVIFEGRTPSNLSEFPTLHNPALTWPDFSI